MVSSFLNQTKKSVHSEEVEKRKKYDRERYQKVKNRPGYKEGRRKYFKQYYRDNLSKKAKQLTAGPGQPINNRPIPMNEQHLPINYQYIPINNPPATLFFNDEEQSDFEVDKNQLDFDRRQQIFDHSSDEESDGELSDFDVDRNQLDFDRNNINFDYAPTNLSDVEVDISNVDFDNAPNEYDDFDEYDDDEYDDDEYDDEDDLYGGKKSNKKAKTRKVRKNKKVRTKRRKTCKKSCNKNKRKTKKSKK